MNRRLLTALLAVILTFAAVGGAALVYEHSETLRQSEWLKGLASENSSTSKYDETVELGGKTYGFDHRIETYLFLGTDASGNEDGEKEGKYHGKMADFLLLMVLDYTDDTYGCIQIDRNTVTEVDEPVNEDLVIATHNIQICVSHWYGINKEMSALNTVKAVRGLLGGLDRIDGYYVLNMEDIRLMNNTVGGVEITFDEDLTEIDPAFEEGETVRLSDEQAERFVRSRMSVGEGTNEERMGRQKQYMDAFLAKVKSISSDDSEFADRLWQSLRSNATTDMIGNDFSRITQMFLSGEDKGILQFEGEHTTGFILGDGVEHEEFYPETQSIVDVMTKLFSLEPVE